ncbi:MAG: FhaA domain-containing protein, partial [Actinomycetota bacterium]
MGLADDFERRLEQVVEGFFSKAFRSRVEPAEVGRRL